jgi:LCP family protein required for cell wall assembly
MKLNRGFIENVFVIFMLSLIVAFSAFLSKQVKEVEIFKLKTVNNAIHNFKDKNILVLGIAGFESNGPLLTDVMMVVNINIDKATIKAISIPRDLLVNIEKTENFTKINNLLTIDNPQLKVKNTNLIKNKISQITGLTIDNLIIVDLDGFRYFIDAIGGINVYLDKPLYDPKLANPDNPNERFALESGWNYLDGKKAAKFVRSRYAATGDFSRIDHQHDLLMSVFQKLKKINAFTNPVTLYKIYSS